MGTLTDTPNATTAPGSGWTLTGAGSNEAALADALDSSFVDSPATPPLAPDVARGMRLGFPNSAIPTGAKVVGVRLRMRSKDDSSFPWKTIMAARPYLAGALGTGASSPGGDTSPTDYTGAFETSKPTGGPWTQADLDNMEALLTATDAYNANQALGGKVYSLARDVLYNEIPALTVSATAGAGVARPTFAWTVNDPEGDPQTEWRAKAFSAAQYGAGGFDPATSAPVWDSGDTVDPNSRSGQVGLDLVNGTTYKVYVRARQPDVSGQASYSAWTASNTVTISITTPAQPGLTATADNPNARVVLAYTKNNAEAGTVLSIQYSDDAKATWSPHPALTNLPITGSGTVYDYESPPRLQRYYRAQVTVPSGLSSTWPVSGEPSAIVQTDHWCLKDVLDPTANVICNKAPVGAQVVEMTFDHEEPQQVSLPIGFAATHYIVTTEGVKEPTGTLSLRAIDKPAHDALKEITQRPRSILVQDVLGNQWYVKLGSPHAWRLVKAMDPLGVYPVRWLYEATIPYVSTKRPSL